MPRKKTKRKKDTRRKCLACGARFELKKENRYEVTCSERTVLSGWKQEILECFDCPMCGCQNAVNIRKLSD